MTWCLNRFFQFLWKKVSPDTSKVTSTAARVMRVFFSGQTFTLTRHNKRLLEEVVALERRNISTVLLSHLPQTPSYRSFPEHLCSLLKISTEAKETAITDGINQQRAVRTWAIVPVRHSTTPGCSSTIRNLCSPSKAHPALYFPYSRNFIHIIKSTCSLVKVGYNCLRHCSAGSSCFYWLSTAKFMADASNMHNRVFHEII